MNNCIVLPPSVAETDLSRWMLEGGVTRLGQGKVRDIYAVPDHPGQLLVVATDRVSIFDEVLNALVPAKGRVLTALTHFWLTEVFANVPNHFVAAGRAIDDYLPDWMRCNAELQSRGMLVQKLNMLPVECVARCYLTGSGLKDYRKTGEVCGHKLLPGLHDGSKLPYPIFTPATKAKTGHDENIPASQVVRIYGRQLLAKTMDIYEKAARYALKRGIIIADTKFEFGQDSNAGLVLGDEVLTPDSSRFWSQAVYAKYQAKNPPQAPPGMDKQLVRDWGNEAVPDHGPKLREIAVPAEVVNGASRRYLAIFNQLTGYTLFDYLDAKLGVRPAW